MHFIASALEYTSGNNVHFLDFVKNLIISIDRVPKISIGMKMKMMKMKVRDIRMQNILHCRKFVS